MNTVTMRIYRDSTKPEPSDQLPDVPLVRRDNRSTSRATRQVGLKTTEIPTS